MLLERGEAEWKEAMNSAERAPLKRGSLSTGSASYGFGEAIGCLVQPALFSRCFSVLQKCR